MFGGRHAAPHRKISLDSGRNSGLQYLPRPNLNRHRTLPIRVPLHIMPEPIEEGQESVGFAAFSVAMQDWAVIGAHKFAITNSPSQIRYSLPKSDVTRSMVICAQQMRRSTRHWAVSKPSNSKMSTCVGERPAAWATANSIVMIVENGFVSECSKFIILISHNIISARYILVWHSRGHGDTPRVC